MASQGASILNIFHHYISGGQFISGGNVNLHHLSNSGSKRGESTAFANLTNHVAPGALHDSGEISEPPKCHPGTRVDVLTILITWALATIYTHPIRWLNGPAGAGKSAIMRSFAEILVEKGLLLASFFFLRSDGKRNTAEYLVPTIAYQLCINIPPLQSWVERAIQLNPLIFTASLAVQVQALIIDPFLHYFYNPNSTIITPLPHIILVDGLDECSGREVQQEILQVLCRMVQTLPIPIAIVFASRPKHQIRITFEVGMLREVSSRVTLDNSFKPDNDIQLFYRSEFHKVRSTHPMRIYLDASWPSDDVIELLVHNASGQFIYASTVIKFVKSNRHNPDARLQIILGRADPGTSKPFQQLDQLYTTIFLNVAPEVLPDALRVLGIILTPPVGWNAVVGPQSPKFVESLLGFQPGHVRCLYLDLESLLAVTDDGNDIRIFHTSLPDFLFDKSRAGAFFVDRGLVYADIASSSINIFHLSNQKEDDLGGFPDRPLFVFYFAAQLGYSLRNATPTESLRHSIISCDMEFMIRFQPPFTFITLQDSLTMQFLVGLKESLYPDAENLYQEKLAAFGRAVNPKLIQHWLRPGGFFRQFLLLVLLLVHTRASVEQVETFLTYFAITPLGERIDIIPRMLGASRARTTTGGWRSVSMLTLDLIDTPTGLLHDRSGQEACTDLTLHLLQQLAEKRSYDRLDHADKPLPAPEIYLRRILPFLLATSVVREDLWKAVRTVQFDNTFLQFDPRDESGAETAAAIDSYIQAHVLSTGTPAHRRTGLWRRLQIFLARSRVYLGG